jgi:hypothetical protein
MDPDGSTLRDVDRPADIETAGIDQADIGQVGAG